MKTGFRSFIGNLNIYSTQSLNSMKKLTEESCSNEGNLLAWKDLKMNVTGGWWTDLPNEKICSNLRRELFVVSAFMQQEMASSICKRLGSSQLYFPIDQSSSKAFSDYHWGNMDWNLDEKFRCEHYWSPFKWTEDGKLVHQATKGCS